MNLLFMNGKVYQTAEQRCFDWLQVEDGKIKALGMAGEMPELDESYQRYDLQGGFLLPSFIDSHSHFASTAFSLLQLSLASCRSFAEVKGAVEGFIRENTLAPGEWITAVAYDHNNFTEKRHPRRQDLDVISPDHPLVVHHQSGHMGSFNSLALNKLGLGIHTPCPDGGTMEVKDGELSGYMEENAFIDFIKLVPMPAFEKIRDGILKARDLYHKHGITTLQEGMMVKALAPVYQLIASLPNLNLDIIYYSSLEDLDFFTNTFKLGEMPAGTSIRCGGLKLFLDGSPQGRTAWVREPYLPCADSPDPDYVAFGTMSDENLLAALALAVERQIQVLIHCNGDRAIEQLLHAAETLKKQGKDVAPLRPVIIHAQLMGRDQLAKVKEMGFIVSYFAAHIYHWGEVHLANLGEPRGSHISPLQSSLQNGVVFTLHQDTPVIEPNMLESVETASKRMTKNGLVLAQEEAVSLADALKAVSANAAYQYFEEERIGDLRPGMRANLVVLEQSPFDCTASIRDIGIRSLFKDGQQVF